jgi:putative transposase
MFLTYRYRIKDGSSSRRRALRAQARSVNFVWNYCCQIDRESSARWKAGSVIRKPSAFDLANLCRGVTKELGIHSDTVDAICRKFANARDACFPKTPRFRSFKRNLDFVPFSNFKRPAKLNGAKLTVLGHTYHLWLSRPMPENGKPKSWNFSTDSRGRWYVNINIELPDVESRQIKNEIGIDLGLKTLATLSDGNKIETPAFYRKTQKRLAIFQRRGQKVRARALSAKIKNQRRHFLHEASTNLVRTYNRIVVGDISSSKLIKTRMAKSIHDAGWAMFKNFLSYKLIAAGGSFEIVSEYMTSQTCSECGCLPLSRPKGIAGLGIRHFDCSDCGASLDRDVNAARNILRVGAERRPPVVGISI